MYAYIYVCMYVYCYTFLIHFLFLFYLKTDPAKRPFSTSADAPQRSGSVPWPRENIAVVTGSLTHRRTHAECQLCPGSTFKRSLYRCCFPEVWTFLWMLELVTVGKSPNSHSLPAHGHVAGSGSGHWEPFTEPPVQETRTVTQLCHVAEWHINNNHWGSGFKFILYYQQQLLRHLYAAQRKTEWRFYFIIIAFR